MITENEWTVWTRGHSSEEREFGLRRRMGMGYDSLKTAWSGVDEYAAVFSKEQIAKAEFDTIFMDVDAHEEGESWQVKVKELIDKCEAKPSRIYVTGRGVHLYWDLTEPIHGAGRYKQAVTALVKKWDIGRIVDNKVIGDVRRMARIPMSQNSKGGYMVRIPETLIDVNIGTGMETLTSEIPGKIALTLQASNESERTFGPTEGAKHVYEESEYPPCIRRAITLMMETGELDHSQRLHLFSFLVANDEKQKGWELLRQYAGDFDAGISEYQLNYLERMHWSPYKCDKVPEDICPYAVGNKKDCAYWPSINVHRQRRMEAMK